MEYVKLKNGMRLPKVGLGTFDLKAESIKKGLWAGYRLLDTAWQYQNETEVGSAVKESGIDREDILVTTKLWTEDVRSGHVKEALERSLQNLSMDYVDLYLIHWPAKGFEKAWEEMAKLQESGKARAIGVCNFNRHHFEELAGSTGIVPVLNQIESHPYFHNDEIISYCKEKKIGVQAWCPLGGSLSNLKEDQVLKEIAEKYHKTVAQIILRWHLQRNVATIPRSSNERRLKENLDVFQFELEAADMKRIDALDTGNRMGADPDHFQF